MLRRTLAIFALLLALAVAPIHAHDELRFVGTVTKFDAKSNVLTVKYKENGKDESVDIDLTAKTEVTRDKKPLPRAQLRPGAYVVVDALGCEDDYEAVAIRIVPAPAPPAAAR
jgi:hypothetical protein